MYQRFSSDYTSSSGSEPFKTDDYSTSERIPWLLVVRGFHHRPDDILIAVLGTEASGVSEFVYYLTGCEIEDQSDEIQATRFENHEKFGSRIVLLTIPVSDGTPEGERQRLEELESWIADRYSNDDHPLSALLYLRPTSQLNLEHFSDPVTTATFLRLCPDLRYVRLVFTNPTYWAGDDNRLVGPFQSFWVGSLLGSQIHALNKVHNIIGVWKVINEILNTKPITEQDGRDWDKAVGDSVEHLTASQAGIKTGFRKTRKFLQGIGSVLRDKTVIRYPDKPGLPSLTNTSRRPPRDNAEAYVQSCALLLDLIHKDEAELLLKDLAGNEAQYMVDFMNKVLEDGSIRRPSEQRRILHLLCKLSKSAQIYPKSFVLSGVQCDLRNMPVNEGGSGLIYKGDLRGQAVCIKTVSGTGENNLRAHTQELVLWAHMWHENLMPFYGVYLHRRPTLSVGIVSPWVMNGDLVGYLEKHPESPRVPLIFDIISGLSHLHEMDIVHADLKAKNVLVSNKGRAMLTDFGVSKVVVTGVAPTQLGAGTLYWMAPELLDGGASTKESDMWAFACTCYEIITNKRPFHECKNLPQLMKTFRDFGTPQRPELGPNKLRDIDELWRLLQRCWNYVPQLRPKSSDAKLFVTITYQLEARQAHSDDSDRISNCSKAKKARNNSMKIDCKRVYSILDKMQCETHTANDTQAGSIKIHVESV